MEQDDPARDKAMQEAWDRLEGLRIEEVPWKHRLSDSAISPDTGVVEDGSEPTTHPLRSDVIHTDQ